jgi:ribosomal protein S18 acetylase RimI-like enzyme
MKVGRQSWVATITTTIAIHQHVSVKWFFIGLLKTTASAFASTNTNPCLSSVANSCHGVRRLSYHDSNLSPHHIPRVVSSSRLRQHSAEAVAESNVFADRNTHPREKSKTEYPISLRLAELSDIPSISSCNLQTLPENYNDFFYNQHITENPFLSLVAVMDVPQPRDDSQHRVHGNYEPQRTNTLWHRQFLLSKRRFIASFGAAPPVGSRSVVVGYLLGKITSPQEPYQYKNSHLLPQNVWEDLSSPTQHRPPMIGHVSSLAILPEARRRGLAQALLHQFHHHLQQSNIPVVSTGLHVRCSNGVAVQLYEKLGYFPALTIPAYYEDGEDAFYMQKLFSESPSLSSSVHNEHFKLPRLIGVIREDDSKVDQISDETDDDDQVIYMNGSL